MCVSECISPYYALQAFAFRLSTSQTPTRQTNDWSEERCGQGGGFGTVMEDGYGVSYMFIGEDRRTYHSVKNCSVCSKQFIIVL